MGLVVEEVEKRNLKWYGRLIGIKNGRKTKQLYEARLEMRRRLRRPGKE